MVLVGTVGNLDPTKTQSFTYTSREQLAGADGLWGEFDYAYDGVGNRVSFTETVGGTPNIDLRGGSEKMNSRDKWIFRATAA